MNFWIFGIAILALALFFLMILKAKKNKKIEDIPWPFYAKKPLSNPEQILYFRLLKALPDHIVLAQVGLSRILGVKKGHNFGEWFNRISRMSADFVICTKDLRIIAIIELDDASHKTEERRMADAKKDKALCSAGLRVVRWQAKAIPEETAIISTFSA